MQLGDLEVGDEVAFAVETNKEGYPQARDITRADGRQVGPTPKHILDGIKGGGKGGDEGSNGDGGGKRRKKNNKGAKGKGKGRDDRSKDDGDEGQDGGA